MPEALISPEFSDFVHREVASGKFRSQTELVSEALRLLKERERRIDALRADVHAGLAQLERGEGVTIRTPADQQALLHDIEQRGQTRRQQVGRTL